MAKAKKSERGYAVWHPEHGFAMWTLSGLPEIARGKANESAPWNSAWAKEGWRVKRVRISIY